VSDADPTQPSTVDWRDDDGAPVRATSPVRGESARYQLLGELGRGGMAVVHRAVDRQLEREVALKLVRPDRVGARERARLVREARALAKLRHPNVVTVYDVEEHDGQLAIAMALIDGGSLRAWLAAAPRTPAAIVGVLAAAGRGLAAAHRAGLVHRDFKPDNVLIDRDGEAHVADFGLARTIEVATGAAGAAGAADRAGATAGETDEPAVTQAGLVIGTPPYLAPELLDGGAATPASDQFAFAVTLVEAVAGRRPFAATTIEARRAERGQAPTLDGLPAWLRAIAARGLATDPAARFPSMDEVLAALARDPAVRRRRLVRGGAVAAAVAVAGVLGARAATRAPDPAATCAAAARPMTGIWDANRRVVLEGALAGATAPYAATMAETTIAALDGYAEGLVAAELRACVLDASGAGAREVVVRRRACLERSRNQLGTLVDRLLAADDDAVARAGQALAELQSIAACESQDALTRAETVPVDPERAAAAAAILARVDRARIDVRFGRARQVVPTLSSAVADARALGHGPTLAEALVALGSAAGALDQFKDAEAHLREALVVAQAHGHDLIVGRTAGFLALELARGQSRLLEAEPFAQLAVATSARLGRPPDLEIIAQFAAMVVARELEQFDAADAAGALALAAADAGRVAPARRAEIVNALGATARRRGDYATAAARFREARAVTAAAWGEAHPALSAYDNNLAVIAIADGQPADAVTQLRLAIAAARALRGNGARAANSQVSLGFALDMAGARDAALAESAAAVEATALAYGPVHPRTVKAHLMRARIAVGAGRADLAAAALEAAAAAGAARDAAVQRLVAALAADVAWLRGERAGARAGWRAVIAAAAPGETDAIGLASLGLAAAARADAAWSDALVAARAARAALATSDGPRAPLTIAASLEEGLAMIATGDVAGGRALVTAGLPIVRENPRFAAVVSAAEAAVR
jgi:predicted Ser/Thr protein kinase/tetratricopeptide (TPR) repeat protein